MSKMVHHTFSFKERMQSFGHGLHGLRIIFRYEHNFRLQCLVALLVVMAGFIAGLQKSEWLAIIVVTGMVFISEMFNSAIEYMADYVSPGYSDLIGKAKDVAAAAVLLSAVISFITGLIIFLPKFFDVQF